MKDFRIAKTVGLLSLTSVVLLLGGIGQADSSRRIPRPGQNTQSNGGAAAVAPIASTAVIPASIVPAPAPASAPVTAPAPAPAPASASFSTDISASSTTNHFATNGNSADTVLPVTDQSSTLSPHLHQANATVDIETDPQRLSMRAIMDWQNRNLPDLRVGSGGTMDGAQYKHKGLKAHLGGALVSTVGTVANAYVPMAAVPFRTAPNGPPKISLSTAHCPAAFDPAFQVPKSWWSDLSTEEGSSDLGPEWKAWLQAVQYVFQSHAEELAATPGVAALHVIINPDGSIYNATPYTGAERANGGYPTNSKTLANLRGIILSVGRFPPFPLGSRVPCYHLVVDGSAH